MKTLDDLVVLSWRLGLGQCQDCLPESFSKIMVLITTGRRSGLKRHTPVNYALIEDGIYCFSAFGTRADWFRNLLANPQVEVWLPRARRAGRAVEVDSPEERLSALRAILPNTGFAANAQLDPITASDQVLTEAASGWRVIRIELDGWLNGPGGPGDLAWVWPAAGISVIALFALTQRKRRRNEHAGELN